MKKEYIILTLIFVNYLLTQIPAPEKKINETRKGDYVQIKGIITEYYTPEKITIINLSDETGSIKTIFFKKIKARKEQEAIITGRIEEYQGTKELIGGKIRLTKGGETKNN